MRLNTVFKLVAIAGLCGLAACNRSSNLASAIDDDLRARHPIVIRPVEKQLIVLVAGKGNGIDWQESDRVTSFAKAYAKEGKGPLQITIPVGRGVSGVPAGLEAAIARGGSGIVTRVTSYKPIGRAAAPVKLSYTAVTAAVDPSCGLSGAQDVGNLRDPGEKALGCAFTGAIATQVAEPSDLVEPRAVSATDLSKRYPRLEK
jgi:pilus assembly protein CpaD